MLKQYQFLRNKGQSTQCVKSVLARCYSGPHFHTFRLNTDQNNSEYGHFSRSVSNIPCFPIHSIWRSITNESTASRNFSSFSIGLFHQKWYRRRLLSSETENKSCVVSSQTTNSRILRNYNILGKSWDYVQDIWPSISSKNKNNDNSSEKLKKGVIKIFKGCPCKLVLNSLWKIAFFTKDIGDVLRCC